MKVTTLDTKDRKLIYAYVLCIPSMPIFDLVGRYYKFPLRLDNGHKSVHCQKYKCGIKHGKEPDNVIVICRRSSIVER